MELPIHDGRPYDRDKMLRDIAEVESKWWKMEEAAVEKAGWPPFGSQLREAISDAHRGPLHCERDVIWQNYGFRPRPWHRRADGRYYCD